jgi:hypothetical protein
VALELRIGRFALKKYNSDANMSIKSFPVEVANLRFDPENPRLPEDLERSQAEMFSFIVQEIGVDDLLDSMSTSGMIEADPVIVRLPKANEEAGKFYVIEGNRRLAALKLLNGEKVQDDPTKTIPPIAPGVAKSLEAINVQSDWDEDRLQAYLGYKHVTSSREWAPEAKARFVVSRCNGDYSPETLKRFASSLGTKVPTLRRWLMALLTLREAESESIFDPTKAYSRRYFGTFYTLLGSGSVQDFLSLGEEISEKPVPRDHLDQLGEFISWTVGTADNPPIVNSRQQKQLSAVLQSTRALAYFRSKKNLTQALMYTEFNSEEIVGKLQIAAYNIEECLPKLLDVLEQPSVQAALADLDNAYRKLQRNSSKV